MKQYWTKLKEKLKHIGLIRVFWIYMHSIKKGKAVYLDIKKEYGSNTWIFVGTYNGSGDVFYIAQYIRAYLIREKITDFVYLFGGRAEISAAKLFPDLFPESRIKLIDREDLENLMQFRLFYGCDRLDIRQFNHWSYSPQLLISSGLEGLHGLSMLDMYLGTELRMNKAVEAEMPRFNRDMEKIIAFFKSYHLKPGKTVILAPYSVSAGSLPQEFWMEIIEQLRKSGYTLCTNSAGPHEPVLPGTAPCFFDYADMKNFVEYAGYFIGFRSGLCDIIARTACRKIVIHAADPGFCLPERAMAYVGFQNMGIGYELTEFQYAGIQTAEKVLEQFHPNRRGIMPDKIKPAFAERNVVIVLASSAEYAPYMAVTIQSIMQTGTTKYNYDILVIHREIPHNLQMKIKSMAKEYPNVSIRFVIPNNTILKSRFNFRQDLAAAPESFYCVVLKDILPEYKKVICLDCDVVALYDVAELYETNIDGYMVAATREPDGVGHCYDDLLNMKERDPEHNRATYMLTTMGLNRLEDYFQSGVMLLNLEEFRKRYTTEQILEVACADWVVWGDQDTMNVLCKNKVVYLDMAWNVIVNYHDIQLGRCKRFGPKDLIAEYEEARKSPKIIHYAGTKPWKVFDADLFPYFWEAALKTPFYDQLINELLDRQRSPAQLIDDEQDRQRVISQYRNRKLGLRYLKVFIKAWWEGKHGR